MDEFENELGWADVSEPIQKEPSKSEPSSGSGISKESPSYLSMGGGEEPAESEEKQAPQQRQAAQSAPPAPVVVQAPIDYNQMARAIHAASQPQGVDPYTSHLDDIVKTGADPEAVKRLDKMVELKLQQAQYQQQGQQQQQSLQAYKNQVENIFHEAIGEVTEAPQLSPLGPSIQAKAIELWQNDPEFAQHYQAAWNGVPPSAKIAKKLATKASDLVCASIGLAKPEKPVSLQSSRPSRGTAGSVNTAGGVNSLDMAQRKYYDAMKGPLGHEKALRSAKTIGR